jgi:hypothetical protein
MNNSEFQELTLDLETVDPERAVEAVRDQEARGFTFSTLARQAGHRLPNLVVVETRLGHSLPSTSDLYTARPELSKDERQIGLVVRQAHHVRQHRSHETSAGNGKCAVGEPYSSAYAPYLAMTADSQQGGEHEILGFSSVDHGLGDFRPGANAADADPRHRESRSSANSGGRFCTPAGAARPAAQLARQASGADGNARRTRGWISDRRRDMQSPWKLRAHVPITRIQATRASSAELPSASLVPALGPASGR